jgi:outer membrane protein TolC
MTKRALAWLTILILVPALSAQAPDERSISLSLHDCLGKAMKNNLGVQVQMLTPELREVGVAQAKEKFMPTLSLSFGRNSQQQASYNFYDAADISTQNYNNYTGNLIQEVPGGGNVNVRFYTQKYDTNRTGTTINPSFRSELRFSFDQPLLRNFGLNTSRREIIVAGTRLEMSEKDLERALQQTVYEVEQAYWNLVYAVENFKATQQSLTYAQDLLERNKRSVEVGTMAPINIISAEAEVASREAELLVAEAEIRNMEDRLKQIINLKADDPQAEFVRIEPIDSPTEGYREIDLAEALATALQNRPDLASSRLGIRNSERDLGYAKNQALPDLSFSVQYWSPGVSGTQLIYEDPRDPFSPIIDRIPGDMTDSFKDVFGFEYKNWSVGLNLNIPLNTLLSRASVAQAQVNLETALLQVKEQEQQIFTDIKIAVRNVETRYKQIQALKVARELAEKQLEAVTEKLKVGLSTNFEVLQYQRDLARQKSSELQAIINYNLALAQLDRDMGISLDRKNVQITRTDGD